MATQPPALPIVGIPVGIPPLGLSGVLPPYVGKVTNSQMMSPYPATLLEIAQRFCHTPHRCTTMRGLLQHRQQLSAIGLVDGFVWLAGSFFEDIEKLDNRNPRDVDAVLFLRRPRAHVQDAQWQQFLTTNIGLFQPQNTKAQFMCDVQLVDLNLDPAVVVDRARFWFGLFSHRRNNLWKGILQVPLAVSPDDTAASQHLTTI